MTCDRGATCLTVTCRHQTNHSGQESQEQGKLGGGNPSDFICDATPISTRKLESHQSAAFACGANYLSQESVLLRHYPHQAPKGLLCICVERADST